MKVVLDAYTFRTTPRLKLPLVADVGYEYIELSPRQDFTRSLLHPGADHGRGLQRALDAVAVKGRHTFPCTAGQAPMSGRAWSSDWSRTPTTS
jgi:hypothetical protein